MEALFEYVIIAVIALGVLYLMTPTVLNFYDSAAEAVNSSTQLSDSEGTLVTAVLLLVLILFFLFAVWIMYGAVQNRINSME